MAGEQEQEQEQEVIDHLDLAAYRSGVKLNTGDEITDVTSRGEDFVLFYTSGSLGINWFTNGLNSLRDAKLRQIDRINLSGSKKRLGVYDDDLNVLYGMAILSVLNKHPEEDIERNIGNLSAAVEELEVPRRVISISERLHVWIRQDFEVDYFCAKCSASERYAVRRFQGAVAYAHSLLPVDVSQGIKERVSARIGAALAEAFFQISDDKIDEVYDRLYSQIRGVAENGVKSRYIWLTSLTVCFLLSLSYFLYCYHVLGGGLRMALIPMAGGFLGTYLSVLARSDELVLDEQKSDRLILIQGALRVILGGAFGLVGYACAEAGIALSMFKDNEYSLLVLGVIAGFSERLVPELINNLSSGASGSK